MASACMHRHGMHDEHMRPLCHGQDARVETREHTGNASEAIALSTLSPLGGMAWWLPSRLP